MSTATTATTTTTTRLSELCASVWALSALRVAAESDLLVVMAKGETNPRKIAKSVQLDPGITLRILEVLEANGFVSKKDPQKSGAASDGDGDGDEDGFVLTNEGADLASKTDWLRADLGATFGTTRAFVLGGRTSDLKSGWSHTDAETIRSQASLAAVMTGSKGVEMLIKAVPAFECLTRPGASLIEVGAGAAGTSIAMCRRFPGLRIVALEPLRAARLEAQAAIAAAGLQDRIDLRAVRVEDLTDKRVHDAAFVPAGFLDDDALKLGLTRIREALVPGGLVMLNAFHNVEDQKLASAAKLRWQFWGGGVRTVSETKHAITSAGLVDIQEGPRAGAIIPLVARAPR